MAGISIGGGSPTSQTSTQDPQTGSTETVGPSKTTSSSLQPDTATHPDGIPLTGASPTAVSLTGNVSTTGTTAAPAAIKVSHHHVSGVDIGIVVILFILAMASFLAVNRTAKNTTSY